MKGKRLSGKVPTIRWESLPLGVWTADHEPDYSDEYRWCRPTLRVALQLGRNRAYAAGTWWTFRLLAP